MDTSTWSADTWVTLAAVVVAILATIPAYVSLRFARAAAAAARDQTALQRDIAREANLPKVWADIRPHPEYPSVVCLFVGNAGPSVARDVRVTVTPQIVSGPQPIKAIEAQKAAANGIAALPPGRVYEWPLGPGQELLRGGGFVSEHEISIEARSHDGPLPTETFTLRLDDYLMTRNGGGGNLHEIQKSIDKLGRELGKTREMIQRATSGGG